MEILDIQPFNKACDEFLAGKYILADVKIGGILSEIDTNEKLKNIVADTLDDYDFTTCFKQYYCEIDDERASLSMPSAERDVVAFVYSLLYQFNTKKLKMYDFLRKLYGNEENIGQEFYTFASEIIAPFKTAINNIYSKTHVIVTTDEYQHNVYNQLKTTIKDIISNADNFKLKMTEKEEFTLLLNSLYLASEKNDKKLVYSLMVGMDYFTKFYKKCRVAYLSLEKCFN